jgi:formate/nitrite transporter FocA (FNT family)
VKYYLKGLCAGILISLGGGVFLSCEDRTVGALFFCVALVSICMLGYTLYTGKICYVADPGNRPGASELVFGLLGNICACVACGLLLRLAVPDIGLQAGALTAKKLEVQAWWQTLLRAFFCGMLVYLSVEIYRRHKTPLGVILCIPTFILSGYEHSIADIFYFSASSDVWTDAPGYSLLFLLLVLVGNSLGGMLLPLLIRASEGRK